MAIPRRGALIEIARGNPDRISSGFEEAIKVLGTLFPWLGEFRLEEKSAPIFECQKDFESVRFTRSYRLWKGGKPQRCCVSFFYNTSDENGFVRWNKTSRDTLITLAAENRNKELADVIKEGQSPMKIIDSEAAVAKQV